MRSVDLSAYLPLPCGADQYPLDYCEENQVLKLREDADSVLVALCSEDGARILPSLRLLHRKPVDTVLVDRMDFASQLGKLNVQVGAPSERPEAGADERIFLDRIANDAPIVNFVNSFIIDAIRSRASDIHIERRAEEGVVRYRVDGTLMTASVFPQERFAAVSSRLKVMANLNIMESRLPQDGRITVDAGNERIDMRASFIPISGGESIVLRVFSGSAAPLLMDQLGMPAETMATVERLLRHPHGLILATGPTGSGKTTSLAAMIRRVQTDQLKTITIEDPIENRIPGVCQIQTNDAIGLSFDSLLRRVLRQDPDVIMVGEIRDHATAELVVRAAMTGHLVLSTLHTNDSVSAVTRLRNIGIEPYLIAGTLRGAIAQRLVRKCCPHCSHPSAATPAEQALGARHGMELSSVMRSEGCPACSGSGYSGRTAIFECFASDESLEELIARGERASVLAARLRESGMRSLAMAGLSLVAEGVTTIEEIEREVEL